MGSLTITREAFERDTLAAEQAAEQGPVFVTEGGRHAYVLMSFAEYQTLANGRDGKDGSPRADSHSGRPARSLLDLIAMPGGEDIEFEPPRLFQSPPRPADFS